MTPKGVEATAGIMANGKRTRLSFDREILAGFCLCVKAIFQDSLNA